MSVRLCYLRRADRGGTLRSVRLLGQGVDERWPSEVTPSPAPDEQGPWITRAADWVAERLAHSRAGGRVELVCLDVEGAACTWLSTPSVEPAVVSAIARLGADGMGDFGDANSTLAPSVGPIEYFAADAPESTIQPFAAPFRAAPEATGTAPKDAKKPRAAASNGQAHRVGVLAQTDVPARLFVDALDAAGVETLAACSLWHALARAWDPGSPLRQPAQSEGTREGIVAESNDACAILLIDPGTDDTPARAIWAWAREGEVLAAGSARLRSRAGDDGRVVELREGDASRLAAEWVAWSLQLGEAPRRVIAIFPDNVEGNAPAFGNALVRHWPGASVDATTDPDPIGATLSRLVAAYEATAQRSEDPAGGHALVELTARPGRAHRRLYLWAAMFVVMAAVLAGVVAWQVRGRAASARAAANEFHTRWVEEIRTSHPQAFAGPPGSAPLFNLRTELDKRRQEAGPSRVASAAPILEELETISLVLSSAEDVSLESLDLVSGSNAKIVVITKDLRSAERLAFALRHIGGSHVLWEGVDPSYADATNAKGEPATRMTFNAVWNAPAEDAK